MKRGCSTVALAAAAAAFVGVSLSACGGGGPDSGSAQNAAAHAGAAAPAAPADNKYAPLAKLPDWSGVWEPARMAGPPKQGVPPPPPPSPPKLTAAYAAQYEKFQEKNKKTPGLNFVSNVANCVPAGLPGSMLQPYPIEFLFTPGRVTIAIETYSVVRRVYTDGSPMPAEPDPSYQGTSVGHWEGDTLVVETTGILPDTSPIGGILGHGPKMQVTERIHLVDPDELEIQTTIEDPAVFTEPYTMVNRYARHRDWKIMEYVCAQNNHDFVDDKGQAGFSLKRNPGEKFVNVQQLTRRTLFGAALVLLGFSASAHHSTAMFQWGTEKELTGTVDKWEWTQPHTFIWVDVPAKAGAKAQQWGLEGMSPSWLGRRGWGNKSLAHGDKVKIIYYPLRDGRPGGFFVRVTGPDGKELQALPGRAPPPPSK